MPRKDIIEAWTFSRKKHNLTGTYFRFNGHFYCRDCAQRIGEATRCLREPPVNFEVYSERWNDNCNWCTNTSTQDSFVTEDEMQLPPYDSCHMCGGILGKGFGDR